jgi:hypothetical protein
MELSDLQQKVEGLADKSHADKIKLLAWYLHTYRKANYFGHSDIKKCYDDLHLASPSSFGAYFANLVKSREILKNSSGYRLESRVREALDAQYGSSEVVVKITELLLTLPEKIPNLAERTYLDEALICYRHGAFRAAVVMTWNLAYHHLCDYVLKSHLAEFNQRWPIVYPGHHKKATKIIAKMDDFSDQLKESEVIEICNSASIITKDVHRILLDKLGRRNSAAHPSSVAIEQLQVDAFIDDLIKNVVLKLA